MFEMDGNTGHLTTKNTSEVYAKKPMDFEACAHASSHLFNDVRLKNFIEIRPADALPTDVAVAYVALVKGLFYSDISLTKMETLFGRQSENAIEEAKISLQAEGFAGKAYGKKVADVANELINIAFSGLETGEQPYLKPLQKIAESEKTLADIACPL